MVPTNFEANGRYTPFVVNDLYRLLMNAGVEGPYELVGHSFEGLIVESHCLIKRAKSRRDQKSDSRRSASLRETDSRCYLFLIGGRA
jgi:hypothetical protein